MTKEIKVHDQAVLEPLRELKNYLEGLDASLSRHVSDDSSMDMLNTLHDMKQQLEGLTRSYRDLLLENTELTQRIINRLKESDEVLANTFKLND